MASRRSRGDRYSSSVSAMSGISSNGSAGTLDYSLTLAGSLSPGSSMSFLTKAPVMQAAEIKDLLKSRLAYLSGGKDRRGGPIISFPSQPSEVSIEDIATTITYLASLPSTESKAHGFSLLVDMRGSAWQPIKLVMKVLQETLAGSISAIYILKNEASRARQGSSLGLKKDKSQSFETIFLSSPSKLTKYLDTSQLTEEFGGALDYHHQEWLQNRLDFEKFLKDSSLTEKRLEQAHEELLSRQDERLTPEDQLRRQKRLREVVIDQPSSVLQLGHSLSRRLETDSGFQRQGGDQGFATEDQLLMHREVDQRLDALQQKQNQLRMYLAERDRELGVHMQLGDMESGIKKVVDWIVGPGEKLLSSHIDIGNDYKTAEKLRREHEKLELKCTDIYGNYAELRHVADSIIKSGHPHAGDIGAQKDYLDTVCRSFASRLERRRNLVIGSVRFHRLSQEAFSKLADLLELCTGEVEVDSVESTEEALRLLLDNFDNSMYTTDRAIREGKSILEMMSLPIKNAFGKDITPNYEKHIAHVERILAELEGRRARCRDLAEVRRLKLQQLLQLKSCERDAEQAIAWLLELLDNMLLQHIEVGRSADEAASLKDEHSKFETTARETYDYGLNLLRTSLMLRRSLHMNLEPSQDKSQRLEAAWYQFSQALGERSSRLSVSLMFQRNAEKLISQMDKLCQEVAPRVAGYGGGVGSRHLLSYEPRRRALLRQYREAAAMGQALLDRLALPVVSPDRASRSNMRVIPEQLQPAADHLAQKMAELENKRREMELLFGDTDGGSMFTPTSSTSSLAPGAVYGEPLPEMDWDVVAKKDVPIEEVAPIVATKQQSVMSAPPPSLNGRMNGRLTGSHSSLNGSRSSLNRMPSPSPNRYGIRPEDEAFRRMKDFEDKVKESAEWIQVRVEDMIPRMTEIGTNLEEAQNLKTQHEEVIKNLVAKQDQIGSLLTQADNQVSTQQFYGDVYAAMAKSLGQAWKDLTRQMETRQKLLDQAVDFYRGAKQYNDNLADGIRECRTMSLPSDPRDVERQQQRTRQIKKDMLEGSMQVMSKGRDLLDRLHDLGSKAGDDSRHATMVSCQGVEKAMEDIQDKRRLLDDLWLERSRKLDQYQHLRDIDTEVTKISNWFRTQGEMYLQKRNIGRSENECSDLLKQHHAFEVAAGDVQNSVANLLATSEQVRHSDPESTERLRSQTRAIDTLCDDFMHRLGERRNTLQRAHDFYRNAELAKTYLSRLGVQLSQERLPKDEWSRTNRLEKLNNAISEISTPVLGEGRALLNQVGLSTPGAETVKENMAEIQAKCVDLQNQARPELREQAEMQATFEEKYTVLIKWLVNVGDAFLMANNDMGDQMQTTMDFLDGHEKLLTEVREKSTQVDNVMAIATKLGSKNRFTPEQTNKLKQHWTRVTVTVENRIRAAHIFIKFHKVAKQLGNAMENMETMLKSEEMRDVKRMKKTTMQHIHEKWNQMVEINIQLDNTGHTFKNELHKLVNDTELVTKTSVHYVELTIKSFGERKIYLDDLYDSLHQKYSAEETFKSQWEHFVRDARKTIEFVINMEGNVFPRLTADAQSLADVKQKKIDSFQETVTKVTTEIQMRLKTAEMLGAKGDTGGEKEQVVERLTSAHHRFMNRVGEYQIVLTLSIDFYKKVNKVNKTMDEAIASYQVQPAPSHTSEAQIRLQQHEEEKRYITELYTTAAKKGDEVIAKIRQSDPVSPARRDVEVTLQAMEERKEHWLNEWSRYRQRLTKASEDTSLKLLKSEFIIHLQRAEDELDGMRKSKESVSLTIEKFTDWEAQIKVLEDQYQHYLSTAHIALKGKPADKPGIQKDIQEVQTYWTSFMKNVDDYRKKMELVVNLRKQYTTLVSNLKLADRQLQDLQQPQVSETLTIEKFQDWQVHIKGLEKEYTNYVSRANIVLDQKPPASTLIERELNEVKNFWVGFNKSVQDYRDKMQLVANIRMQYKTLIMNMEQAEDDLKDLESTPHSSSLIIEKHEDWEAHIKVLEDEYKKYVSSAHIALDRRPPSAGVIEKDLAEAERYWSKLNRQINDYRHKVEVIFNIHKRFKTLAVRIQKATKHVEELKTDFGEKAEDLPEIQKKFATFEQDIKPLEVEHRDFVTVATGALAKNPPNASAIKRDVDDINRFWSKLNVSLQDQRKKLKTAPKFHELYKTVVEWQVKAEDLLVAVGQKKPLFTAQEQAAEVLGEVEDFIEKGDARQKARLFKLNEMAIDLYSHKVPPRVTSTINTNRELLDAIQVTNDELFALANNLPKQTPVQAKADETVVPQVQRTVQTVPLVKSQKPVPAPPGLVDESVLPVSQKPVETKPWQPPPPPKAVQESVVPQYQKPAQMKQWKAPRPVRQVAEIILPDEQTSDAEIPLDRLPETSTKTVQLVQPESPITQTRKEPLEAFPTFPAPEPEPPKPVGYAPYFTRKIRDNLVKQGRATQLDCVVKGDPAPEVQWYKDDVPVRTSNNLRVECGDEGLCALSFYNTQPEAAGVYTMKAFNVIGEAACKAKLNVQAVQEEFVLPKQVPKVSTGHIQLTHNALMPKFIQIPGDKNVEEGKPLCLEVMVDAYPDPNVVWSKDGIKVKGEPYILKEDGKTHTLIIPEADLEDEGIFICTATNPAGRAECIIQVKVNEAEEPPVFITPLVNAQAKKGAPFAFECVLKGDPVPVVEWLKNNKPVNADNPDYNLKRNTETGTCRLEIDEVFPEDAARYTCRATNEAGKAETTSMLSVMGLDEGDLRAPAILSHPEDVTLQEGDPIRITCQISGELPISVKWFKDDEALDEAGEFLMSFDDREGLAVLQVNESFAEDEGVYTCQATNAWGRTASSANLTVVTGEDEVDATDDGSKRQAACILSNLQNVTVKEGTPFKLACVVDGVAPITAQWFKGGEPLDEGYEYVMKFQSNMATLQVNESFPEDSGMYTCRVMNAVGSDESSAQVTVLEDASPTPPWIQPLKLESSYLEIPVGQPIKLAFKVSGNPEPTVTWHHNDRPLRPDGRIKVVKEDTTYTMQISQAEPEDTGKYTIRAENEKGQESSSVEINVPRPPVVIPIHQEEVQSAPAPAAKTPPGTAPRFKTRLKDLVIPDGQPFELTCKVAGMPVPNIVWYKDNKELTENEPQYELSFMESVARLDVREAFLEDAGLYTCQATNNHGRDVTSGRVEVKSLPQAPPVIKPISHESSHLDIPVGQPIVLKFNIEAFPPPVVRWYHDGVPVKETPEMEIINEETDYKLVIKEAKPEYAGTYTVVAENDKGQESTSIEIDVVPPETQMEVVPTQAEPTFAPLQSRFFTQPDAMPLMGAATPPRFQSRLKDIEVTEGEPIEIAIRVTGQPTPRITWYKDDKPIAGKPQYEMSFVESVARLDVREAFLEDEGRYVCKATNPAGQDTTTCQITVKVNAALVPAPHITPLQTQYSHLDIPVGQPIRLHFRIRGQPPPKVTWLQNDVEIVETEEVEIIKEETVHTLVIKNPRPDAGGKYTVVAENDRGTETVNIVINVSGVTVPMPTGPGPVVVRPAQPIVFTEHLTDKQVVESTEIKLRVRIEEKPSAQVQWFFNNTPIQPSDRVEFLRDGDVYYLVIKKPTSGDAGLYQCRAETEVSVVTTECTIMVNEKQSPDFIAPLESVVASEGCTIRLECRVSGSPAPTVKWTKDERSITETSRVRFLTEGDRQILMILQVRPSDSGNYRITLTNEFGVSVSSATLLVDDARTSHAVLFIRKGEKDVDDRPTIVIRLNDQEVQPGDRVQFRVKIQGTPQPTVQWFKNSIEIQTHPYIEISQTGEHNMLTIPKVGPQDAGTYSVVATNDKGRDVSAATLVVDVPKTPTAAPHFAQTFGNRRCYEGESLTFECRITGDPKPSVSWFKDGVKVEQGVFQISEDGQFHKLEILEVFDEDAGVFECRAKNDYGEAICVATLRIKGLGFVSEEDYSESIETTTTTTTRVVYSSTAMSRGRIGQEEAPKFTQPLKSVSVKEGQTATLQAELKGQPEPTVKWFKDDKELKSSPKYNISFAKGKCMLKVSKASAKDDGQYKCTAENKCGNAMCSATLQIQGDSKPPEIIQGLQGQEKTEGDSVRFEVKITGTPKPDVKWFQNGDQLENSIDIQISDEGDRYILVIPEVFDEDAGEYTVRAENAAGISTSQTILKIRSKSGTAPTEEVKPQPPPQEQQVQQQPQQKEESAPPQEEKKAEQPQQPPPQPQPEVKPPAPQAEVKKPEAEVKIPPPQPQPQVQQQPQQQVQQEPAQPKPQVQQKQPPPPAQKAEPPKQQPPPATQKVEQPKPPAAQVQQTIEIKMAAPTEAAAPKPSAPPPPAVTSGPVFTKTLSDITVKEGKPVKLECAVKGQPQPDVKWYREGALMTPSPDFEVKYQNGVSTLTILEIFYDDAGQYACSATNSKGTKSTSCNVRVLPGTPPPSAQQAQQPPAQVNAVNDTAPAEKIPIGPPEFSKPLLPARYSEGGRCRFACTVKGNPAPKITWLRQGQPIESGYRFVIKYDEKTGSATLDITMMLPEDKGEYTCIAKSKAGQVYLTAPLLPPAQYDHWAQEYEEQKAIEKAKKKKDVVNKELETKVHEKGGKITPSQATYHDADQDTPQRRPSLSPFQQRLQQEVEYRERIGRTSIYHAPMEWKGPFDVAAFEASLLNQKQPQESESMEAETETELESELETSEASQQRAPRFLKELKNFRVSEGGKIALSCRVEGRPKPSIQWFKDGYPVPKSIRYDVSYMEGFSQFRIDPILPEDKGAYTVFAWNQFGKAVNTGRIKVDRHLSDEVSHMKGALGARVSMETEEYHLPDRERQPGEVREKHYKPTFKVIPSDLEVKEGKLARFNCRVTGRPPPDLVWYRNEMPVYPDANHRVIVNEGGEHALMISHARPQDGGMYTCIASNRAGEAKFQVKLHVDPKRQLVAPSFIDRIENATVRENEAVTLTCKVTGCPTPHVSWQRDQKHIMPNAGGYRMQMSEDGVCQLFIERVTRHDSAWYTCTAHNSAGRVSCRSRVQVIYDKLIKDNEPAPIFQRRPTQSKKPPPPPEQEEIPSYVTQYDGTPETDKKSSVKPEFVVPLNDNMKKKEGSSAHFACRLQPAGDPTMRIEWFKNNTPLFIGSRVQTKYEFGICSLDIKGVYPEDAGTITCRATNKYGQTETTGKLTCEAEQSLILDTQLPEEMRGIEKTIKFDEYLSAGDFPDDSKFPSEEFSRPELVTVPEPVSILEGENARFSCRISGVPAPRVSWFREDLQIIGQGARMRSWFDGIHYMEITKARVGDSGVIRLVARNKLGMVEFKTKLEVKPKDVPPPLLKPTPKEEKVPQPKPKIPGLQKTQAAKPHEKPNELEEVFRRRSQHAAPFLLSRNQAGTPRRVSAGPALAVKLKPVPKSSSFDMAKETNKNRLPFRDSLRSTPAKKTDMNLDDSAKRYPSLTERTLANDEDITPVVVERKGLDGIKLPEDEQVETEVVTPERNAPMNLDMLTDADKVPVDESVTSESVHSEESSVTYLYQKLGGRESKLSVEENITAEVLSDGDYEELSFPERLEHMPSDGTTDDYTMPTSSISDSTQAQEEPQKSSRSAMYFQPVYRQTKNGGIYSDSETSTPVSSEDYLPALEIEALEEEVQPRQQNQPDLYRQHDGDYLIPISREEVIPLREQAVFSRPKQRDIFENDSDTKTASSSDDEDGSEGDGRSTPVNSDLSTNLKGIPPQEADDPQTSDRFTSSFSVPISLDDGTDKVGCSEPYIVQLMLEKPPIENDTFDRALPVSGRSGKSEDSDTFKNLSSHSSSSSPSSDSEDNVQPIHKDYVSGRKKNEQPYAVEDMLEKSPIKDDKVDKVFPFGSSSLAQGQRGGDEPLCSSSSSSRSSSDSEELEDQSTKVPNPNESEPFIVEVMLEKPPIQDDKFDRALPVQPGTLTQKQQIEQRKSSNSSSSFSSESEESYKDPVTKEAEGGKVEPYIAEVMLEKPPIQDDKFDRSLPISRDPFHRKPSDKRSSPTSSSSSHSSSSDSGESEPESDRHSYSTAIVFQRRQSKEEPSHVREDNSSGDYLSSSRSSSSPHSSDGDVTKVSPLRRDDQHYTPLEININTQLSAGNQKERTSSSSSSEYEHEALETKLMSRKLKSNLQGTKEEQKIQMTSSSSSLSSSSSSTSSDEETQVSKARLMLHQDQGNQEALPQRTVASPSEDPSFEVVLEIASRQGVEEKVMEESILPVEALPQQQPDPSVEDDDAVGFDITVDFKPNEEEQKPKWKSFFDDDEEETFPRLVGSPFGKNSVIFSKARSSQYDPIKPMSETETMAQRKELTESSTEDGGEEEVEEVNENRVLAKRISMTQMRALNPTGSPIIKQRLQDIKCKQGESITFHIDFTGIAPFEVTWYQDGYELEDSDECGILVSDDYSSLTVPNTTPDDNSMIEVQVKNDLGVAASTAMLTVEEYQQPTQTMQPAQPAAAAQPMEMMQLAPCFLSAPPPMTVGAPGEPVRLSCRVGGNPVPKVIWSKDGRLLTSVPRMKILQDEDIHTLLILECLPEDAGNYTIEIVGPSGKKTHCFRIQIQGDKPDDFEPHYPEVPHHHPEVQPIGFATLPEFRSVLTDCLVPDGSPVELACEVVGTPPPVINWYHNGGIIKPSRYFRMSYDDGIARLQINEVFQEDGGEYVCEAFNNAGRISCSGILNVQVEEIESAAEFAVPPKFLKKIVNLEVAEGSPARFECKVVGSPRPEVQWFHEGRLIQSMPHKRVSTGSDGTSTLYIPQVLADDSGRISVTASNPAGQVTCSSQLLVEGMMPVMMQIMMMMMIMTVMTMVMMMSMMMMTTISMLFMLMMDIGKQLKLNIKRSLIFSY
ncbi:uncharacterized protein LOC121425834 isoform X6 [Lytechinus variegatus]|uniref:uncharacterized protein LOC121425834 isoform X6 n=1 Tax=Lytechinus variegatus TaxID=7654 RepID=UPI001BB1446B|nr:uncharacterized protein LOC121425834 isoform X6 [Lytechinus variegatus]